MAVTKTIRVNGKSVSATVDDPATPLLYILRNDAGLHGPRFGCRTRPVQRLHRPRERRAGSVVHPRAFFDWDGCR